MRRSEAAAQQAEAQAEALLLAAQLQPKCAAVLAAAAEAAQGRGGTAAAAALNVLNTLNALAGAVRSARASGPAWRRVAEFVAFPLNVAAKDRVVRPPGRVRPWRVPQAPGAPLRAHAPANGRALAGMPNAAAGPRPQTPLRQRELCLELLVEVLDKADGPPRHVEMVKDLLTTAAVIAHGQLPPDADETRSAALRLVRTLCSPLLTDADVPASAAAVPPPAVVAVLYAPATGPDGARVPTPLLFAHLVSALLDCAAPGHALALQLSALDLLERLGARSTLAVIGTVLPGVVSGLVRLLLHDL